MDNNWAWLQPAVTLIVGLFVFIIYNLGHREKKKNASKILLIEIEAAQDSLKRLKKILTKENPHLPEDESILPTSSWKRYNHLFIRDFDKDQWALISDFYKSCELLDEAISLNNSFFSKNEQAIRTELYSAFGSFVRQIMDDIKTGTISNPNAVTDTNSSDQDLATQIQGLLSTQLAAFYELFLQTLNKNNGHYSPTKPITDTKAILESMNINILDGVSGEKIKKIAKRRI